MCSVKSVFKTLYILLIGLLVFTGALMIAQGLRTHQAQASTDAAVPVVRTLPDGELEKGFAL